MSTATRTAPRLPGDLFIWYVILFEGATFCVLFGAFAFTRARHLELFSSSQQQLDLSAGAINTALQAPAVVKRMHDYGMEAQPGTPQQFFDMARAEARRWGPVIKAAGVKLD